MIDTFSVSVQKSTLSKEKYDLVIIGGGVAGLTAGIYGGRAGLSTLIIEKNMAGGQAMNIAEVENWPGERKISGEELAMKLKEHASQYSEILEFTEVKSVRKVGKEYEIETSLGNITSEAVIFATGAKRRELGVPGEDRLKGRGVSYCATCDGNFFVGRKVIVVGGANTAFSEAVYLKDLGVDVKLVHRRRGFRAERALIDKARERGIEFIVPYVVEEILGEEEVEGVRLRNMESGETLELKVNGVFVAIGTVPNSKLAKDLGVKLDERGYIVVGEGMRTNLERVYAAGDVTGGVMQLVVAASEGAIAALSAKEDLTK